MPKVMAGNKKAKIRRPLKREWWEDKSGYAQGSVKTSEHLWDFRFMRIAREVSRWSKCQSRQIGAVIVRDKLVISTGFNGAPRGVDLCQDINTECPRKVMGLKSGEGTELCPANHAEVNAILQAARNGIRVKGATIYCWCDHPCKGCTGAIINAGIKKIVCLSGDGYDRLARRMLRDTDIEVLEIDEKQIDKKVR